MSRRLLTELLIQMNQITNLGSDLPSSSSSKTKAHSNKGPTCSSGFPGGGVDTDICASTDQAGPQQEKQRQGRVFIFAATNRIQVSPMLTAAVHCGDWDIRLWVFRVAWCTA
jgi:hypothetical protein